MVKKLKLKAAVFSLAFGSIVLMTGCDQELAPDEDYDVLEQIDNKNNSLTSGLQQVLEVPGQNFKLITEYTCDDSSKREWRITSDKFLELIFLSYFFLLWINKLINIFLIIMNRVREVIKCVF